MKQQTMKQQTNSTPSRRPWHSAFDQALRAELEQYKAVLDFTDEYRLTAEPLKIDVLIVKKAPEAVI